jgi:CD109 antigen
MLPNYPEFTTARDNANTYLKSVLPSITDVYELAIIAHALLIAEDAEGTNAFNSFYALRTESATEIFWAKTLNPPNFWYSSLSLDIETSSHGLINLVKIGDTANGIKVAKYLAGQANNLGGYSSSQDTVMALLSLAEFSTSFSFGAVVDLTLTPDVGDPFNARVDSTNAMTLQQFELDNTLSILNVKPSPSSTGLAIVSLTCNYYQDPSFVVPVFDITHEFYRQCKWSIGLRVCASHIPKGNSNMAIITVALPSGFQYQEWWGGPNNPDVTKVETLNSGSKVVFYFNTIRNKPSCVDVNAYRAQTVTELKGGTIIVNDYYDTSKEGSAKYPAPDLGGSCWY